MKRRSCLLAAAAIIVATLTLESTDAAPALAHAVSLPNGFSKTTVVTDLINPVGMEIGPDGRIYVLTGRATRSVSVVDEEQGIASTWLELPQVLNLEMGLHGITWHPDYPATPYVYLSYIAGATANTLQRFELVRYRVVAGVPIPASKQLLFSVADWNTNTSLHQGGDLAFGPDGKLYWALGDRVDPPRAQQMNSFGGKVLRLNENGTIPVDNPFYSALSGKHRAIYALGLRNPWRMEAHPVTGELYISSVGPADWEELDLVSAGANYGWPTVSGPTADPEYTSPVWYYPHDVGGEFNGCAITGGGFMPAGVGNFPSEYDGALFIGDHCGGWIDVVDVGSGTSTRFLDGLEQLIDVVAHPTTGALYYLDRFYEHDELNAAGGIGRIDFEPTAVLAVTSQPADVVAAVGQDATMGVEVIGQPPFAYQWLRDGEIMVGENSASLTVESVQSSDDGAEFFVVIFDSVGAIASDVATLTVTANSAPVPTIEAPTGVTPWVAGDTIAFAGSAADADDGPLSAAALSWDVVFHHNTHSHPFIDDFAGVSGGTFVIPTTGETAPDIWYRVYLTATDSAGASATTFRDIHPVTAQITIDTAPSGGSILLDSQPITTPHTFTGVAGIERQIEAPGSQTIDGTNLTFRSWSTGETGEWTFTTPSVDSTIIATYANVGEPFVCGVNGMTLSWSDLGATHYYVRRIVNGNNSYLGRVDGALSFTIPVATGSYEVVAYVGGQRLTTSCPASSLFACQVNGMTLSWSDLGATHYYVRRIVNGNNSYLGRVDGALSFTIPVATGSYEVVAYVGGQRLTTSCPA